jgi:hypothetical protein
LGAGRLALARRGRRPPVKSLKLAHIVQRESAALPFLVGARNTVQHSSVDESRPSGVAAEAVQKENGVTDRGRVDSVPAAEDAVRKVQRLKKAIGRSRALFADEQPGAGVAPERPALVSELRQWEEQLEAIRCDLAELLAERDRMRIAHDKLRERIDRHTLEPRSEPERKVQALPLPAQPINPIRPRPGAGESQDFTAIDRELERLNASMLAAFSSSE